MSPRFRGGAPRPLSFAALVSAASLASLPACKPDLDQTTSRVTGPRFLAVRSEPAEAAPETATTFRALFVDSNGELGSAPIDWAFCEDRKPLAELGPVSPRCLARAADFFDPIGVGAVVSGALPREACRQFGPDVPETKKDEPPGRPVDPDSTGGYYQPVRLAAATAGGDLFAIGRTRLTCGVVGASPEQLADLAQRSHPNTNVGIDALTLASGGALDASAPLGAGQRVVLRATWATCADGQASCTGAEHYASFDPGTQSVVGHVESIRVSWFATDGAFDDDHTGRDGSDATPSSDNGWTAPASAGTVHLWVVARDDRGGVGWSGVTLTVR